MSKTKNDPESEHVKDSDDTTIEYKSEEDAEPKPEPKPEHDVKVESKPEPEHDVKVEPKPEPKPEHDVKVEPESKPKSEPRTKPKFRPLTEEDKWEMRRKLKVTAQRAFMNAMMDEKNGKCPFKSAIQFIPARDPDEVFVVHTEKMKRSELHDKLKNPIETPEPPPQKVIVTRRHICEMDHIDNRKPGIVKRTLCLITNFLRSFAFIKLVLFIVIISLIVMIGLSFYGIFAQPNEHIQYVSKSSNQTTGRSLMQTNQLNQVSLNTSSTITTKDRVYYIIVPKTTSTYVKVDNVNASDDDDLDLTTTSISTEISDE